jgi:hypothetical protein
MLARKRRIGSERYLQVQAELYQQMWICYFRPVRSAAELKEFVLQSPEYGSIKTDYDQRSQWYSPRCYVPSAGMTVAPALLSLRRHSSERPRALNWSGNASSCALVLCPPGMNDRPNWISCDQCHGVMGVCQSRDLVRLASCLPGNSPRRQCLPQLLDGRGGRASVMIVHFPPCWPFSWTANSGLFDCSVLWPTSDFSPGTHQMPRFGGQDLGRQQRSAQGDSEQGGSLLRYEAG